MLYFSMKPLYRPRTTVAVGGSSFCVRQEIFKYPQRAHGRKKRQGLGSLAARECDLAGKVLECMSLSDRKPWFSVLPGSGECHAATAQRALAEGTPGVAAVASVGVPLVFQNVRLPQKVV
jgi:hypothetical protein